MVMAHAVAKKQHPGSDCGDDLEGFDELVNEPLDDSIVQEPRASREISQFGISSAALSPGSSNPKVDSASTIMLWKSKMPTNLEAVTADICHIEGGTYEQPRSPVISSASNVLSGNALRRLSINLTDGIKKRIGSIGFGRNSSLDRGSRGYEASSYTSPSQGLQTMASVACIFEGLEAGNVEVFSAPVKTIDRMREKVLEYAQEGSGGGWPLCANILDPVRASVVCRGPEQILQVLQWFAGTNPGRTAEVEEIAQSGATVRLLPLCRVKNKFAFPKEELVGG